MWLGVEYVCVSVCGYVCVYLWRFYGNVKHPELTKTTLWPACRPVVSKTRAKMWGNPVDRLPLGILKVSKPVVLLSKYLCLAGETHMKSCYRGPLGKFLEAVGKQELGAEPRAM